MFEVIRTWLNGTREYFTGVAIFDQVSKNVALKQVFAQGSSVYNRHRLVAELTKIFHELKAQQPKEITVPKIPAISKRIVTPAVNKVDEPKPTFTESDLYKNAHLEATKLYKVYMNKRAELFALCKVEDWQDQNNRELVKQRCKLAIEVVELSVKSAKLFEVADYVKEHNRMPQEYVDIENDPYEALPDHLVKQTLNNARKAYNKLKDKPATEERLHLMQKHQDNIKILEAKWRLLNSQQTTK
ncbi:hypothetical protein ACFOWM_03505 [Ferruginibacter yonginensis]|uniref:Uncharacterized protein n=1 Tax=Ferruginibacter yonginensis TaxID=1310416 RepID=A0ABV8QNS3_9BACT